MHLKTHHRQLTVMIATKPIFDEPDIGDAIEKEPNGFTGVP